MSTDGMLQALGRRLVEQEIHYCVSSLVYALAEREQDGSDGIDPDDLATLAYRQPDAGDYRENMPEDLQVVQDGDDWKWKDGEAQWSPPFDTELEAFQDAFDELGEDTPEGAEVYEHWIVSNWLARKLEAEGEAVCHDLCGLTIWGRATTGQSIALDHVIQQIALATYGEPEPVIPDYAARAFVEKVAALDLQSVSDFVARGELLTAIDEARAIVASARVEG